MTILIIKIIVIKIFIIITITIITIIMKWELPKQKPLRIINLQVAVARISTSRSVDQERSQSEQCFLAGNATTNSTGTHHFFFVSHFCNILKKTHFMRTSVPGQTTAYCSGEIRISKHIQTQTSQNYNKNLLYQPLIIPIQPDHTHPTKSYPPNQIIPSHTSYE